ncbi:hypothetical protein [Actinomadura rubrisoli]|uniref:DUF892 family protein n=1 Tax=Actinomadura rubrisoli TaxID=2530368 RepID=A0A4R5CL44_9ACTN|nr:hypothetical protein [Actinomadura rubrisoli]TDD98182.1 hypothetical protein E1298_00525 [Actinomadura rubrisoli]
MGTSSTREFLGIYLNDHLAGAAGGVELARRLARAHRGSDDAERLTRLAADIAADRGALLSILRSLGIPVRRYKSAAARAAEKAGRLKFNGRLLSRSPLSDLVELEALRVAVEGKAAGWRTLLDVADQEPELDAGRLRTLLARADAQVTVLEELRIAAVDRAFRDTGAR